MPHDRRQFIKSASAASLLIALHEHVALAQPTTQGSKVAPRTRLRELRLHTTTALDELEHFYADVMGLPTREITRERITIAAGETTLTYLKRPEDEGAPWYHVAFNIPENKIVQARDWQLERTPLANNPRAARHPDHPDIVEFAHWDAHSVFFRDPAGNLLEHIARHTLDCAAPGPFSSRDILCCSEIALVHDQDDIRPPADDVGDALGLTRYRTSSPRFVALGDENGLILNMRKGVSMRGRADVFPTHVVIDSEVPIAHDVPGFPYRIESES